MSHGVTNKQINMLQNQDDSIDFIYMTGVFIFIYYCLPVYNYVILICHC